MKAHELQALLARLPKQSLTLAPTPIHPLPALARAYGAADLWIKRDDLTGLGPGGNKVRNLEYLIGQALADDCDTIIAAGPVQSNLCTLAACAANRLGLDCFLVHNGNASDHPQGNQLLNQLLDVHSIYLGSVDSSIRNQHMKVLAHELEQAGKHPFIIENGASSGLGILGYVDFMLELKVQNNQMENPVKTLYVPAGNGGVAAGCIYGNYLLDQPFEIVVISVEYKTSELVPILESLIHDAAKILHTPIPPSIRETARIYDRYAGDGWGINTPQSEAMLKQLAKTEGLFVEDIYTSKTLAGMCDLIQAGEEDSKGACYLHTGGFSSLFAQY